MADARTAPHFVTARQAGLVGCRHCGVVHQAGRAVCSRCGAGLVSRDKASLQRVWAWLIAGVIAYIPANVYPMLLTSTLGQTQENTIVGGAIDLFSHGAYAVAAIVFVASVLIPIGKFIAIGYLAFSVRAGRVGVRPAERHHLYEVVEFIGRWSMIDIFMISILVALVKLGSIATIEPGVGATSFAAVVIITILAAMSFDPRLIWDSLESEHERTSRQPA